MRKLLFCTFTLVFLLACNEDNNDINQHASISNTSILTGEWVTKNESNNCYTDIIFDSNQRVKITLVQGNTSNKSVYKEDEGAWLLYDEDYVLNFSMMHMSIPNQEILELSKNYMKLRNQVLNSVDVYYQIVETIELDAGYEATINYLQEHSDYIVEEYSNVEIASISNNGKIKGHQGGVAYLSLRSGQNIVYVKLIVRNRIDKLSEELKMSIEDIKERYGEPEVSVPNLTGNYDTNSIIYHETIVDSDIDFIRFLYDPWSSQITSIQTIYKSSDSYNSDVSYIRQYLYKFNSTIGDVYGKSEFKYENSCLIIPRISNNDLYVDYINQDAKTTSDYFLKPLDKQFYMEPYTNWGCSVEDVKEYMHNCEMINDIAESNGHLYMGYYGVDNNNKIIYEYHFDLSTFDLYEVLVIIYPDYLTINDINSHLRASGYTFYIYYDNPSRYWFYKNDTNVWLYPDIDSKGRYIVRYIDYKHPQAR